MIKRTEAIVLKNKSFADADLIVTYLTKEFGILNVFAKSPKKIKSRFGSSLEPLTYSNISFFGKEETNLPRLIQSDIIKNFQSLREDFKFLVKINEMLELCTAFLPEKVPYKEIFFLLLKALHKLENNCDERVCSLYYKLKFLETAGLLPSLELCGRCRSRIIIDNGYHKFSVIDGSILCKTCHGSNNDLLTLSTASIRFFNSILKWNYSTIDRIKAPEHLLSELSGLINSHINHVFGIKNFHDKISSARL